MDRLSNLDVLKALVELKDHNDGMTPTVRELGSYLGVTGPSVQRHINALVASGFLSRRPGQPRTMALTDSGRSVLAS